jgi:alkanesulfonate monooxygenase
VFFYPTGHHIAAWRHPESQADAGLNFRHCAEVTQTAERGKLDMIFLADTAGVRDAGNIPAWSRHPKYAGQFEPLTLLSALSTVTQHVGLVATATTTYNEPYHVARMYASLDYLSNGRAGWNVVTSSNPTEAFNFGRAAHVAHGERYDRAREFVRVVKDLWDSWEDDAFVRDRASGRYFDPEKLHIPNHVGKHFSVKGPLSVGRPPQGYPVIFQAGSSETGKDLAAETAEAVFTAQPVLADAQAFYADLKGRLAAYGRRPDDLKIMPGVMPVVGETRSEADAKFDALQALIHPDVGLSILADMLGGVDLSPYALDAPFPTDLPESTGGKSRAELITTMAEREGLTLRETYMRCAVARGHWTIRGTPRDIADQLETWFESDAADGFNIMPLYLPGSLDDFVTMVVPELQRRGLFRTEYEGTTLRENLGLTRPPHPATQRAASRHSERVEDARSLRPVAAPRRCSG